MHAAQRDHYGPPDVIHVRSVPTPSPGAGEVLVRVGAASVSRTDCAVLTAQPFIMRFLLGLRRPRRPTLGTDFAGRVDAVGSNVKRFHVGDRVWGIRDMGVGSHAERLVVNERDAVDHLPGGLGFVDAAACLEGGWYAWSMLERVPVTPGMRVLVIGATGAIGSALVQLAAHRGAVVTAVGHGRQPDLLPSLGAERVIDYEHEDFTRSDGTYERIFDAVGKSTFGACRHLLTPRGIYLSSELGPGAQNVFLPIATRLGRGRRTVFPLPVNPRRFLEAMAPLAAGGHFRPVIDRTVTLDGIRDAYAYVASGQKTGTVILTFPD
jgi:NADPH:quinone reductase-like Zn-dependent oxidoreductase